MSDEVELISDGDGIAVIGSPTAVDRFLSSEGLMSKDLGLQRLRPALVTGSAAAQAGSGIAAQSGRWVKLTEKSAQAMKKYDLMKGSEAGVSRAVVTDNGKVTGLLEIVRTPGAMLTNPAVLSGAAGLMAQLAMQQTMEEITDYLAKIDQKVDDVLRAQKDAVLADMMGVDLVIEEALTVRERVGGVGEVTWSKVQSTAVTIARSQAYALRQLDALAEKLERETDVDDLAEMTKRARVTVDEWLAVLAHCFRLQDALAVLELDRVLGAAPEELDRHRLALRVARQNRLELIARTTGHLLARMDAAASTANTKVLLNPINSRNVVRSRNEVVAAVAGFHGRLGIEDGRDALEARRWLDAAADVRDKVLETGAEGVGAAKTLGSRGVDRASSVTGRVAAKVSERARRRSGADGGPALKTSAGAGELDERGEPGPL